MQLCGEKTIFPSQTGILWILFIEFYSADHVLSADGDALSGSITSLWPAKKLFLGCLLA